jgi:pimeloyl-ACP methyl ester carboxylesterase
MSKIVRFALFGLASLLVFLVAAGVSLASQRAYDLVHPPRVSAQARAGYENVVFSSTDGLTLRGWYAPPVNGATIIFVHGHAANRAAFQDEALLAQEQGYGILLFDLRNHGLSEGDVTSMGLLEARDVLGAIGFVQSRAGTDSALGLVGQSMGSAAVLLAAAQSPAVDCVVAMSAYTSVEDNISQGVESLTGLPAMPFAPLVIFFGQAYSGVDIQAVRPVDVLNQISPRPLLFVHGEKDSLILVENAHSLYRAAREPKELYVLPNAGHGGFYQAQPIVYPARLFGFFQACLRSR